MDDRQRILNAAIVLFSTVGYASTTTKDIATATDLPPAQIYNHFNSKDAILEAIYRLYNESLLALRPEEEQYLPILRAGTAEEILNIFNFPLPEPIDLHFRVVRIVQSRKLSDRRAMECYLHTSWETSVAYIGGVMDKGVEIGRINMTREEIASFTYLVHATREYSANLATMIPEQATFRAMEVGMMQLLSGLIRLNDPVDASPRSLSRQAAVEAAIAYEAHSIGRYHYYASLLKQEGESTLAGFVTEISENILSVMDVLYAQLEPAGGTLDRNAILRRIADRERNKLREGARLVGAADTGEELTELFTEISELALQHERICKSNMI